MKTNYIGGVVASLNLSRALRKLREQLILNNFIIEGDNIYFKDIENKYSDLWDEYCEEFYPEDTDVTVKEQSYNSHNKSLDFKVIIKIDESKNTFNFRNFCYKKDKDALLEEGLEYARYDILSLLIDHEILLTYDDYRYFLEKTYQLMINNEANIYYKKANSKFLKMLEKCEDLNEEFVEKVKMMNVKEHEKAVSKIEDLLIEKEKDIKEIEEE